MLPQESEGRGDWPYVRLCPHLLSISSTFSEGMKIIFGSFRNATRDIKLTDSTIGGKGGGHNCNDGFLCTGFHWKAQSIKRFLTNLNSQGCELPTSRPFFIFPIRKKRENGIRRLIQVCRAFAAALIVCYLSFVSAATALLMLSVLPICRFSLQPPIAVAVLKIDPTCLQ